MYDPSQKSVQELERDLMSLCDKWKSLALDAAEKECLFKNLEKIEKVILASQRPQVGTEGTKEEAALKSEAYTQHLQSLDIARKAYLRAEVLQGSCDKLYESLRSVLASRRAQMQRGIE